MEIASVALFEPSKSGGRADTDQAPRNGFQECLGASMDRGHEAAGREAASPPSSSASPASEAAPPPDSSERASVDQGTPATDGKDGLVLSVPVEGAEFGHALTAEALERLDALPGIGAAVVGGAEEDPTSAETVPEPVPQNQDVRRAESHLPSALAPLEAVRARAVVHANDQPPIESEPDGTEQPGQVRRRAAVAFSGTSSSERLWGFWLKHRQSGLGPGALEVAEVKAEAPPEGPESPERTMRHGLPVDGRADTGEPAGPIPPGRTEVAGFSTESRETALKKVESSEVSASVGREKTTPARATEAAEPSARPARPVPASEQVANAARLSLSRGGERVTLQLEPESLGKVHVVLTRGDGGVTAQIRVENPLTHQALQADAPLLRQALEARGVNVAHVSVEMQQGEEQRRETWGGQTGGGRRRNGRPTEEDPVMDEVTVRGSSWRPWGFEARI